MEKNILMENILLLNLWEKKVMEYMYYIVITLAAYYMNINSSLNLLYKYIICGLSGIFGSMIIIEIVTRIPYIN